MFKLSYSNFKSNLKKYVAIMTAVMIAMMFIIASESIFSSYGEVKVRNAYRYNGVWDYRLKTSSDENIKVDGVTYRGYAENQNIGILDIIPEMEHIGNYVDCTDRYLLAITGIDNDLYNTIPYKIMEGDYPASADELLVAQNTVYNGEILKTGDVIELDIKERHDADGNILGDDELSVVMYIRILPQGNIQYAEYMTAHHLQREPLSIMHIQENQEPVAGYIIIPATAMTGKVMKQHQKLLRRQEMLKQTGM